MGYVIVGIVCLLAGGTLSWLYAQKVIDEAKKAAAYGASKVSKL